MVPINIDEIREKYLKEKGKREGREKAKLETARNLLDILDDKTIATKVGLKLAIVKRLREENK